MSKHKFVITPQAKAWMEEIQNQKAPRGQPKRGYQETLVETTVCPRPEPKYPTGGKGKGK